MQRAHDVDQRRGVVGADEETILFIPDKIGDSLPAGGHNWDALRHGLEVDGPQRLADAGEHEHVGFANPGDDGAVGEGASEFDGRTDP